MLIVLLILLLCCFAVTGFFAFRVYREYQCIKNGFFDFVTPPDDKSPSPLGMMIKNTCTLLAGELSQQLRASMMGTASALSKQVDEVNNELVTQGNPLLAGLMAFSPKLANKIVRSPILQQALMNIKLPAGGHAGGNGSKTSMQSNFKL